MDCSLILNESIWTKKEADEMYKKIKGMETTDFDKLDKMVQDQIKATIEDGIDTKMKKLKDMIKTRQLRQSFKINPKTKQPYKNYSEMLGGVIETLMGRNSVDTKIRSMRSSLVTAYTDMEMAFGVHKNQTYTSLSKIEPDSDVEKQLYTRIMSINEYINPRELDPSKIAGLVKKYGDDEIARLALSMKVYNEVARQTLLSHGINVKYKSDYVMKRRYDAAKLEKMTPKQFAEYMYGKLDHEKTFGTATSGAAYDILMKVHKDILEDANNRTSQISSKEFNSTAANSHVQKFHFKDNDSAYEAFKDLSIGGMRDQFERNARAISSLAVRTREFGYDAGKVVEQALAEARKDMGFGKEATFAAKGKISIREGRIKQAIIELTGNQNHVNGALTTAVNTAKTLTAIAKLGNAITTAMLDPLDNMRQVFYVNGSMFGGIREHVANFTKVALGMNHEQRVELANHLGVIFHHMSNAEGMRLANGDLSSTGTWFSDMVHTYGTKAMNVATFLPTQTGYSRLASGLVGANTFGKLIDKVKGNIELNKFEIDTLKEYGISMEEAKVLANDVSKLSTWSREIYTGKNIRDSLFKMKPEELSAKLGVDPERVGDAVIDLAAKYERFLNDFVTRGTPAPEMATKTLLHKNSDYEVIRAAVSLGTQFMDTPIAQAQNMAELIEKISRINDGSFSKVAKDIAPHVGIYVTTGVGLYLAYDGMVSALVNRESKMQQLMDSSRDDRAKIMANIIGRTSTAPFVSEMIEYQFFGRYNETALDAFVKSGPVLSTASEILRVNSVDKGLEVARRNLGGNSLFGQAIGNWSDAVGINPFEQKNKKFWE